MESVRPGWKRTWVPVIVAVVAAAVVGTLASLLVRDDVARRATGGVFTINTFRFVAFFGGLTGVVTYLVAKRLFRGVLLKSAEWMLIVPRIAPGDALYRETGVPTVARLLDALTRRGYALEPRQIGDGGAPGGYLDPRAPLPGAAFFLHDRRLGPPAAGVVVRLADQQGAPGLGTVEARGGEKVDELALYAIAELDALVPGVTYKASDSALTPDPAAELRAVLPDRPRALPE